MKEVLALLTGSPGWAEALVLGLIALLIFGKRLPDVARSLGKSITSFKRGLKDVEKEIESEAEKSNNTNSSSRLTPPEDTPADSDN